MLTSDHEAWEPIPIGRRRGSSRGQVDGKGTLVSGKLYQVALSFAGEQRDYVEEVARHLRSRNIAVFYDGFERVQLWGRSGAEVFNRAFEQDSANVLMFISKAYVEKAWTRHERRSALSRMVQEQGEYILPVRFDDTPVPGLPRDLIYERASDHTPAQLSVTISKKLGMRPFAGKASSVLPQKRHRQLARSHLTTATITGSSRPAKNSGIHRPQFSEPTRTRACVP